MMNREGFLVSSMMSFVELQGGGGGGCSNGHSQKHNASWDWETNNAAAAAGFQIPVPAAAASFQHQASLDFPPTLLPAPGGLVPFYAPAPEYSMGMVKREDYYGGGGLGMGGGGGGGGLGLNLGRRTYFSPSDALAVERILARSRGAYSLMRHVAPRCQAEGCGADLSCAKHYHRRHKVCEFHAKAAVVAVAGLHQRFCQQCSRFHVLSEFDEAKRSCRKRLADHNRRRRKPQQPAVTSAASKTSSATNSSSKTKNVGAVNQVQKTSADREKNSSSTPKSTSTSLCTTMGQFQKQQRSSGPALSLGAVAAADQKSGMLRANYQAGAFVAVAKEKDSQQQQQQLLHSFHNHHHSLLFSSSHETSQPTEVNQCRVNLGHAMFEDDYV